MRREKVKAKNQRRPAHAHYELVWLHVIKASDWMTFVLFIGLFPLACQPPILQVGA